MHEPFFAQDETAIVDAAESLREHARARPDLHWIALVDSAFDYRQADGESSYPLGGVNCYRDARYEGLEVAAPRLVPLQGGVLGDAPLRKLLRHCSGRPMLAVLGSRESADELERRWRALHWSGTDDGQRMLLRIADTRVLPQLPVALTPAQWKAWAAPLHHWFFIDRQGRLAGCEMPDAEAGTVDRIVLSQPQLDLLLAAAEADTIIDLLRSRMPDVLPADLPRSRLHAMIDEVCRLSGRHGIDAFNDTVSLAVAACLTGGESTRHPALAEALEAKTWTPGELGKLLVEKAIV